MEGCSNFQPSPTPSSLPFEFTSWRRLYLIGREMDGIIYGSLYLSISCNNRLFVCNAPHEKWPKAAYMLALTCDQHMHDIRMCKLCIWIRCPSSRLVLLSLSPITHIWLSRALIVVGSVRSGPVQPSCTTRGFRATELTLRAYPPALLKHIT
jgi:hypothetical protein